MARQRGGKRIYRGRNWWPRVVLPKIWELLATYKKYGFRPTLRQVFYQLVSMGILENTRSDYNQLSDKTTRWREDGIELIFRRQRLGIEIDEDVIFHALPPNCFADRVRYKLGGDYGYDSPEDYIFSKISSINGKDYTRRIWESQPQKVVVCLEKDALAEFVRSITTRYRVPLIITRGYSSFTTLWEDIILEEFDSSKRLVILILSDLDPSGEDIVRDIEDRTQHYVGISWLAKAGEEAKAIRIKKVALTEEQVKEYNLLRNPLASKKRDPRSKRYRKEHGEAAYELDALDPLELRRLIEKAIVDEILDKEAFFRALEREKEERRRAKQLAENVRRYIGSELKWS